MIHALIRSEVVDQVERLDLPFNRFGFDPYGVSTAHLKVMFSALTWLYDEYFRVEAYGLNHVPDFGRAMLVGNHSGGFALDATMLMTSVFWKKEQPRLAHGMADKFLSRMPVLSDWTSRTGQFTGLPGNAQRLLEDDRVLMVYPEGAHGTAKLFSERRSLVRFGHGFVRLALQTNTPIVPNAFIGGGEAVPTVFNAKWLGKLVGVPYLPFTPYLVPLPKPVPCEIHFGEPLLFKGDGTEPDDVIDSYVQEVKSRIQYLIDEAGTAYDLRHQPKAFENVPPKMLPPGDSPIGSLSDASRRILYLKGINGCEVDS